MEEFAKHKIMKCEDEEAEGKLEIGRGKNIINEARMTTRETIKNVLLIVERWGWSVPRRATVGVGSC